MLTLIGFLVRAEPLGPVRGMGQRVVGLRADLAWRALSMPILIP